MLSFGMKSYWVYILASRPRGTLYVGMTNDLIRRIYEHREGLVEGFTKEHGVKMLVFFRTARDRDGRDSTREKHQALVAPVEDRPGQDDKSGLARFVG